MDFQNLLAVFIAQAKVTFGARVAIDLERLESGKWLATLSWHAGKGRYETRWYIVSEEAVRDMYRIEGGEE